MDCEEQKERLVLVGFGSHRLSDMLEWVGTKREMELLLAFKRWPPVYREEKACEPEDIQTACDFLSYLGEVIKEYETDKENKDGV